jgi:hypothetical protein
MEEMKRGIASEAPKVMGLAGGESVLRLYECPISYITSESMDVLSMVRLTHETNILPLSGGWADQPNFFVEAYQLFSTELYHHSEKRKKAFETGQKKGQKIRG